MITADVDHDISTTYCQSSSGDEVEVDTAAVFIVVIQTSGISIPLSLLMLLGCSLVCTATQGAQSI